MNKYFFLIFLSLLINKAEAQPIEVQKVRFGIKAGANFSHINFSKGSPPPAVSINTNWQPGIVAGLVVVVPLAHNFYFQPEYLFSQMGGKIEDENRQYEINYVSLPVLLHWEFFNNFSFLAGPQFDLLLTAREKTPDNSTSIERVIEHRSIGLTGGLEYSFTDNIVLGIKYLQGLNHIGLVRETGYEEFKYDGVHLSLSYLF